MARCSGSRRSLSRLLRASGARATDIVMLPAMLMQAAADDGSSPTIRATNKQPASQPPPSRPQPCLECREHNQQFFQLLSRLSEHATPSCHVLSAIFCFTKVQRDMIRSSRRRPRGKPCARSDVGLTSKSADDELFLSSESKRAAESKQRSVTAILLLEQSIYDSRAP